LFLRIVGRSRCACVISFLGRRHSGAFCRALASLKARTLIGKHAISSLSRSGGSTTGLSGHPAPGGLLRGDGSKHRSQPDHRSFRLCACAWHAGIIRAGKLEQCSENRPTSPSLLSEARAQLERDRERLRRLWAERSRTDYIRRRALEAYEKSL